jgi:ubiquinone/menaquinone biosynthesis C-methylase UbiE
MLSIHEWHNRYLQQSRWTQEVRRYIFNQLKLQTAERGLEVGCGSGAITADVQKFTQAGIFGLDTNLGAVKYGRKFDPESYFCAGNAYSLPYSAKSFDFTFCHFLLLWLKEPLNALLEMKRVTRRNGYIIALAEPDYGGRIDFPESLVELGKLQADSLQKQGAEPRRGRQLAALFHEAGLSEVQVGLLGGIWGKPISQEVLEDEWKTLSADLQDQVSAGQLKSLYAINKHAWDAGDRILFVPTFYAWGRVL